MLTRLALWLPTTLLLTSPLSAQSLPHPERTNGPKLRQLLEPERLVLQKTSAVFYRQSVSILFGTVVSADGQILTKASELGDPQDLRVRIDQSWFTPRLLATDPASDLALLQVDAHNLTPVTWSLEEPALGTWVVSNGASSRQRRRARLGIISAQPRPIPQHRTTTLGASFKLRFGRGLELLDIEENGPAAQAKLQKKDLLLTAEGQPLHSIQTFFTLLQEKKPGDTLQLTFQRQDQTHRAQLTLTALPEEQLGLNANDHMSGRFSKRRTDFPRVLQHDTMLSRTDVGGPLLNLSGQAIGLNIAAANRVESFALTASEITQRLQALRQRATTPTSEPSH